MKKSLSVLISVGIILLISACSIGALKPHGGIWYCEELSISVDFSLYESTNECAKLYDKDGICTTLRCFFDYGNGMSIVSTDQNIRYLIGTFNYQRENDYFTVTAFKDEHIYTFVRIQNEALTLSE